jgi:hypothetical protein
MGNKIPRKGQVDHGTVVNLHPKNQKLKIILRHKNKIKKKMYVKMDPLE